MTVEVLKKDPTTTYKNKLVKIIREWKKEGTISDSVDHKIYPTSEYVPKFYGLPKIHKKDSPLKPIVSGIGSISYKVAKYLTVILSPMMGKNGFTLKNSEDFVNKVKDLEVPPPRKMVSYDVSAIFTSIPVDEAIQVICGRLEKYTSLSKRRELSIDQVITLLEFCLNTIYFVCDSMFYLGFNCQIRGAPRGSSISPEVANLVMGIGETEDKALDSAPTKSHVWYHYVDNTFMILQEYAIQDFTDHINSQSEHIKFTLDAEQGGQLPFLDILVIVNDDAH